MKKTLTGPGFAFSTSVSSPATLNPARALLEAGLLGGYYTTFGLRSSGSVLKIFDAIDGLASTDFGRQLRRRAIEGIPSDLVHTYPWVDLLRTVLSRIGYRNESLAALQWQMLAALDRRVSLSVSKCSGVYAFWGAAEQSFRAAKRAGGVCVYNLGGLDIGFMNEVREREKAAFPETRDFYPGLGATAEAVDKQAREWSLADLVIVNSQAALNSHRGRGLEMSKVRAVPLGFPPAWDQNRSVLPLRPLKILWAGNFSMMKGGHHFSRALRMLGGAPPIEVSVYGKQLLPDSYLRGLPVTVDVHTTVPRTQLFDAYRKADLLVLPTLSDGFGMVVSEAMSQGCPVITTNRAGVSQFVEHGRNGLIVPAGDAEALAGALEWCVGNREALARMGAQARRTAMTWQWSDYRAALAATVKEALDAVH